MPHFQNNLARVYFETWGDSGEWITLLNGYSRTLDDFKPMARFLSQRGFRVISLDNRGSGRTESGNFSLKDSINDVAALWDHVGISSSGVLGMSYGGALAQGVALDYEARVSRVMLVSTTCNSLLISRVDNSNPESLKGYFSKGFEAGHQILVRALIKEMGRAFDDPSKIEKTMLQRNAIDGYDFCDSLSQIKVPVLILHGGEDQIVKPACADLLKVKIPHAELKILPGVGHLFLAEAPKKLYDETLLFFSGELAE